MLTFAAPTAPLQNRDAEPFPAALTEPVPLTAQRREANHGGGATGALHATYWPCELLNAFTLKMASLGRCVNTDMMLGHRPYALQQLAAAQASHDTALSGLATRLQAYFDAATPDGCKVAAALDD
ncbi:MAG: hypothetical protein EOO27_38690, partial [Comamonadaceae bacterium]